MRIHRFFVGDGLELSHDFWLHDERLIWQWRKVLRMHPGQEVVLFDGVRSDRLYRLVVLGEKEAHLQHVTDYERKVPQREVYLLWSILKKDNNDWILQKATELGVSHFVPLLADRSEKLGFDTDRAKKIIIEAAEQCGRSDIPSVREPLKISTVVNEMADKITLFVCEQGSADPKSRVAEGKSAGVIVGPEGGWSPEEKKSFIDAQLSHIGLGIFTLRAETAAVVAVNKMV